MSCIVKATGDVRRTIVHIFQLLNNMTIRSLQWCYSGWLILPWSVTYIHGYRWRHKDNCSACQHDNETFAVMLQWLINLTLKCHVYSWLQVTSQGQLFCMPAWQWDFAVMLQWVINLTLKCHIYSWLQVTSQGQLFCMPAWQWDFCSDATVGD